MLDNREIINEAFFKRESRLDKLKKSLPQYEPDGKKSTTGTGINSISVNNPEEIKKRLVSSFGAIVGNNTIKTMAKKAIKTFPIIISDNIDPETAVLIKKATEEQYAQYVELLISNQIIDASQFTAGDEKNGNIAIQALDKISGADFSKRQGLATKTADGEISLNDIARNDVLFNLIRQESAPVEIDDMFTKALLESAIVMPANKADYLVEYIQDNMDELITEADDWGPIVNDRNTFVANKERTIDKKQKAQELTDYLNALSSGSKNKFSPTFFGSKHGSGEGDHFEHEILVDPDKMDKIMDKSIGQLLDSNPAIKDRFEKATFLLYSHKITGSEYISFLTQRLGIPVSQSTRRELIVKYRATSLYKDNGLFTKEDIETIGANEYLKNRVEIKKVIDDISKLKVSDIFTAVGIGSAAGITGIGISLAAGLSLPLALAAIVPALVGSGVYLIAKFISKSNRIKKQVVKMYGWERVEALIETLDLQRRDVQKAYEYSTGLRDRAPEMLASSDMLNDAIKKARESGIYISESVEAECENKESEILQGNEKAPEREIEPMLVPIEVPDEIIEDTIKTLKDADAELREESQEYNAELFTEATIKTTVPIKAVKTYEFDPKKSPETIVVPEFGLRNRKAYGSVEYDARQVKDRRYNQPLIMKINFRERFSDGTFSDNEMTAVIGILGVVTRVPSEDMEEILKANAEGVTLKGALQSNIKQVGQSIVDLFGLTKNTKKKALQSSEVWENLEKVAKLAIINKFTGNQNNNISNAHIVFSQKEIDDVRNEINVDYLKDKKLVSQLMKKYSAFTIMVANDIGERLYIFDDLDAISWNLVPYSALRSKDGNDALTSALMKISDRR